MYQCIYIVDDNAELANSVKLLFDSVGLKSLVFTCAEEFLSLYDGGQGCLILDVRMPGISGLKLQEILISRKQYIPIVFMTGYADVAMAVRAMKNGAIDFLTKPFNSQELLEMVQSILQKNICDYQALQNKLKIQQSINNLTAREKEVMLAVVDGHSNKAIAKKFSISTHTVELHRANVMKKMRVKSLAALVRMVIYYGEEPGAISTYYTNLGDIGRTAHFEISDKI